MKRFIETYFKEVVHLGWADFHLDAIKRLQEVILKGARFALALPRGSGKTTLMRLAALWAISYGHCRYLYIIAANADKAVDSLDSLKQWMRGAGESPWIYDFPEISHAVISLGGIANRASGQLCEGTPTQIAWGGDRIVLPTVPAPPEAKLKKGAVAVTSGVIVGCSGLTGDGIRGSLFARSDGTLARPDLCLLDDIQTDESAGSPSQVDKRMKLINGAVLGMAGPAAKLACMAAITIIQPDDAASRLVDRGTNPEWRGDVRGILTKMPDNMQAWEKYFEILGRCHLKEPPDFKEANTYFRRHKKVLEKGTKATWPKRFIKGTEVNAIQSAMHKYFEDRNAFFSEFMNQPVDDLADGTMLPAEEIAAKQHAQDPGKLPIDVEKVTAFIDVQGEVLFCVIMGFTPRFDGYVLGYTTFPEQVSRYFTLQTLHSTFSTKYRGESVESRIYKGLNEFLDTVVRLRFKRPDGIEMGIDQIGIDSGWMTRLIERMYLDRNEQRLVLTRGVGVRSADKPWSDLSVKPGDLVGEHWRILAPRDRKILRRMEIDTNYWKSFVHARFATEFGDPGSFSIYKAHPTEHRLFADHLTAEYRVRTEGRGRTVDEWKLRPGNPDNHWLDGVVGCAALASRAGCSLAQTQRETRGRGGKRSKAVLKR